MKIHSICTIISAAIMAISISSCIDLGEKANGEGGKPGEEEKPNPEEIAIEDVKLSTISICADDNPTVLYDIEFRINGSDGFARVDYYDVAGKTNLISRFDAVASKVEVNGVNQVSGETGNDFTKDVTYRLYASDGQYKEYSITLRQGRCSGADVVSVHFEDDPFNNESWVPGELKVIQKDIPEITTFAIEGKKRGHYSSSFKRKPYTIRLSSKSSFLGMAPHKRWILLSPEADRTFLRNAVAYEIGRRTDLAWTPNTRFCDLIVNGEYNGCYLVAEQIRVDKNRVAIKEMKPTDIEGDALTGGFLLEVDRYAEDVHFTSRYRQLPINIKSPDSDEIVSVQAQYIEDYINKIEELLYSGETFNPDYKEFLDIDSFVDYWIVNELIYSPDIRIPGSVWMYKDRLGKLCAGPIWDYDIRTFNGSTSWLLYNYETDLSNSSETNRSLWYKRLFEDPEFKALAKLKWEKYKPYFESIPEYIDEQATIISPSVKMTLLQWPDNAGWNTDVKLSWEEAVSLIKENYLKRLEFLNKQIQKF